MVLSPQAINELFSTLLRLKVPLPIAIKMAQDTHQRIENNRRTSITNMGDVIDRGSADVDGYWSLGWREGLEKTCAGIMYFHRLPLVARHARAS